MNIREFTNKLDAFFGQKESYLTSKATIEEHIQNMDSTMEQMKRLKKEIIESLSLPDGEEGWWKKLGNILLWR